MTSHSEDSAVYLEDLDTPKSSQKSETSVTAPVSNGAPLAKKDASKNPSLKRQATLDAMFSQKTSSEPSAKKLRLDASTSSLSTLNGLQKLNSIPFSLKAFRDSLNEEQSTLLQLECQTLGKSWFKVLKDEIKKPYFIALKRFLWKEGLRSINDSVKPLTVYPSPADIYRWSNTPLGRVKVVIIGQDPYPGRGQAQGLCFSVPLGVAVPGSLLNIYAEIKAEYPDFVPPRHGCVHTLSHVSVIPAYSSGRWTLSIQISNLSAWASNGVLMLNTCLSVQPGNPGSHSGKGWEQFTDKVVDVVNKYGGANLPSGGGVGRGVVFMAWGAFAQERVAKLDKTKHLILTSAHPSPRAAHRGFLGNGHFRAANEWLEKKYGAEGKVDWCRLDVPSATSDGSPKPSQ
ncbi:hypothetical protein D9758_003995 [Tetrapyrgos nigripes]|uniref:Uracil-DNA glycosylase n=1 Tax=Tetrapyrgos nigripes TaxID=182062 RepID=A0A8H5GLA1_9AGAR|nr:hypothetical protein D9758_003995 [Tetrapyrgos nigripes]